MLSEPDNTLLTRTGPKNADGRIVSSFLAAGAAQRRTAGARRRPGSALQSLGKTCARSGPATARSVWYHRTARTAAPICSSAAMKTAVSAAPITAGNSPPTGDALRCRPWDPGAARERAEQNIRLLAYPTREAGGFIWAYLGPREQQAGFAGTRVPDAAGIARVRVQEAAAMQLGASLRRRARYRAFFPSCTWRSRPPPMSPSG